MAPDSFADISTVYSHHYTNFINRFRYNRGYNQTQEYLNSRMMRISLCCNNKSNGYLPEKHRQLIQYMVSRQARKKDEKYLIQAKQRYDKQRQRNIAAVPGVHEFVVVLDNLKGGFNVPKIFRSAEAFGAHSIHLVNVEWFDPAPAKGSFRKVPAKFFDEFSACYKTLIEQGYTLYMLAAESESDEVEEPRALISYNVALESKSAFILGHEAYGHSFEINNFPLVKKLAIPHFGSVESLNVSVAASIVMYEYVRQHNCDKNKRWNLYVRCK